MSVEVRVDLSTLPIRRFAEGFPKRLRKAMRGALAAVGRDMVGRAKQLAPADTGDLRRGMDSAILETDDAISVIVFNRFKHSIFVHGGSKYPGKMPPPSALVQWARRHRHLLNRAAQHKRAQYEASGLSYRGGIGKAVRSMESVRAARGFDVATGLNTGKLTSAEKEIFSLAWAIAKAIKRRGSLPARPFLRDAFTQRKSNAESLIRQALQDAMGHAVNDAPDPSSAYLTGGI